MSDKDYVTRGNVFEDLGFDKIEASNLKLRAELMLTIRDYIEQNKLTQAQAAKLLNVDQPQVSRIIQGKIELFTIDKLIKMLATVGIDVSLKIAA